jgi:Raf kinase inhibitor-like YbhB/YbcL family protein
VWRRIALLGLVVGLGVAGCGGGTKTLPTSTTAQTLEVRSSAFSDGGAIPADYSCQGSADAPPPLSWSGVPDDAKQLAIVVEDPDARGFVHWLVTGLPTATTQVDGRPPAGAVEGKNSAGQTGWTPVCPPKGRHHYQFAVYALDAPVDAGADDALARIGEHAIASGVLTGTFERG